MENTRRNIRMGEIIITENPANYCMLGLGSCIGLVVQDSDHTMFGLAHTALPNMKPYENLPNSGFDPTMPAKFTDLAVKIIAKKFRDHGFKNGSLHAKIVGGGQIFDNDIIRVGPKNLESVRASLKEVGIKLDNEVIGGKNGVSIVEINADGSIEV